MVPEGLAAKTLAMPGYLSRVAESTIEGALQRRGAVLIEGSRACGKTWAGRRFARSEARLDDPATLLLADADPRAVLKGPFRGCLTNGRMRLHFGTWCAGSVMPGSDPGNSFSPVRRLLKMTPPVTRVWAESAGC